MDDLRARRSAWRLGVFAASVLLVSVIASGAEVTAKPAAAATLTGSPGYWLVASDGGVYQFGATNFGSLRGHPLNRPVVGVAATTSGLGYWLVASDGGIFSFGDAVFHGSTGGIRLNQPVVGLAADPATGGYWMVASDGGVFAFHAPFFGSTGNVRLNEPIEGMAVTPDGGGYWLVGRDGGVFVFGDARFFGSTGNIRLNQPVVGIAPDGHSGYWIVARDGGIFAFGAAHFYGSAGNIRLNQPIVGMAASPTYGGYWMVAVDGGIFSFGSVPYLGSTGGGPAPIIGMAVTSDGYPFPPGGTGYDVSLYQCGQALPASHTVSIVQVSGGALNNPPNPCYLEEAAWAGVNMSAYVFMDGLPSPAPAESLAGPAGTCHGQVNCESYNFGWYWASRWVGYSRSVGVNPTVWWLDVESGTGGGPAWSASPSSNGAVIAGAVAALRARGVTPGIYSTATQWGEIAGGLTFPGIPLWIPGGGDISDGPFSAHNFCAGTIPEPYGPEYEPFVGGVPTLVQYGWVGNGYSGPPSPYDLDYACR